MMAAALVAAVACDSSSEPSGGSGDGGAKDGAAQTGDGGGASHDGAQASSDTTSDSMTPAATGRSCLSAADGKPVSCREYSAGWSEANIASDCAAPFMRVETCPAGMLIGTCKDAKPAGAQPVTTKYYAGSSVTFMAICMGAMGTWQP
jgi:hypothetical protein